LIKGEGVKQVKINETLVRNALMLEAIGEGVYGVDKNGVCFFINQSALEMLEFNKEEILYKQQHDIFHYSKFDKSRYLEGECPIYSTLKDGKKRVSQECFITKSGKLFPVSLNVAPFNDNGVVVVFKDITKEVEILDKLNKRNRELDKRAITDGLTGLYNRRYFDENYEKEFSRAVRGHLDFAIGICDIDYFKAYNDTYGHQRGDEVIRAVADILKQTFSRQIDIVARYGGEEFVFVLSLISKNDTLRLTQKAKENIECLRLVHERSEVSKYVTVSFGLVCVSVGGIYSSEKLLKMADNALYESKNMGRNRITLKEV
jgi:diguanylate cyclase (GGDEF)-like protein/PAS domain S-box-containing protein